jgi:2-dehydro-3-deoxygluconokinase
LLRKADIVLGGLREMSLLLEEDDPKRIGKRLREDYGVEEIVLKDGARGAMVVTADGNVVRVDPVTVGPEIDPTGAGDAFNSGYLAGRLRGMPLGAAAQLGAVMGGFAVAHRGDFENLPRWDVVQGFVHGGSRPDLGTPPAP